MTDTGGDDGNSRCKVESIEGELLALATEIADYRIALNTEGVWLFLAALGCWSVAQPHLRLVAITIAVALFGHRLQSHLRDPEPFSRKLQTLDTRIQSEITDDRSRKALLYEVLTLRGKTSTSKESLRPGWPFFLCWGFMGATLIWAGYELVRSSA
jgi:hypothetical protein